MKEEDIMENNNQEKIKLLSLVPIDVQEKKFQTLMLIYEKAMMQAKKELEEFQANLKEKLIHQNMMHLQDYLTEEA